MNSRKWKPGCYEEREANIELSEQLMALKAERDALKELNGELVEALETVIKAIKHLPEDSFGEVQDTPDQQGWFIRDELIYNISKPLNKAREVME